MVNLGTIIPEEEKGHFDPRPPLEADWFKKAEFVSNKEEEPSPYRLMFDFMIGGAVGGMEGMLTSSSGMPMLGKMMSMFTNAPPISLLIETDHPVRGKEHVRIRLTPFSVLEGPPPVGSNIEPDIIMRIDYYDLVRILMGEISFVDPVCDGHASIEGNLASFMEFEGVFEIFGQMFGLDDVEGLGDLSLTSLMGMGSKKEE